MYPPIAGKRTTLYGEEDEQGDLGRYALGSSSTVLEQKLEQDHPI